MLDASEDDRFVPISALQHFAFCPRQCALIHVERMWIENDLTAEGRVAHERVDSPGVSGRGRIARAVQLRCERLGLVGKADVVEFLEPTEQGGREVPFPIEYKRGRSIERIPDRIQLCAQAMALEEMTGAHVLRGALFYHSSRKRVLVEFDPELRQRTEEVARQVQEMIESRVVPQAALEPKCKRCSLHGACQPVPTGRESAAAYLAALVRHAGMTSSK